MHTSCEDHIPSRIAAHFLSLLNRGSSGYRHCNHMDTGCIRNPHARVSPDHGFWIILGILCILLKISTLAYSDRGLRRPKIGYSPTEFALRKKILASFDQDVSLPFGVRFCCVYRFLMSCKYLNCLSLAAQALPLAITAKPLQTPIPLPAVRGI